MPETKPPIPNRDKLVLSFMPWPEEHPSRMRVREYARYVKRHSKNSPFENAVYVAQAILTHYFGEPWLRQHFGRTASDFITREIIPGRPTIAFFNRTINLAQYLFNQRFVDGVQGVMATLAAGNIESAYSELETGALLAGLGVRYRFVVPKSKSRSDYDLEFYLYNGTLAASDVKQKPQSSSYSAKSLMRTLKRARAQCPQSGMPIVIFLKIPQTWGDDEIYDAIVPVVFDFLRQSTAVVSVQLYRTLLIENGEFLVQRSSGLEIMSITHSFDRTKDWSLAGDRINLYDSCAPLGWLDLPAYFGFQPPRVLGRYSLQATKHYAPVVRPSAAQPA